MRETRVARRYAAALFARAKALDVVDLVESDLGLITYSLDTIPRLADALHSPLIPAAKKREIVTHIFRDKIHELTLHYLYLLIDKRREALIRYTEPEFIRLANEARGIVVARLTMAVEPTEAELARLKEKLSAHTGKRVELQLQIDPSIIGGVVVRIGDTVMDGSVAGFLAQLRERLLTGETARE